MLGIPFLTAAWWAAKALSAKDAVQRFINPSSLKALAIVAAAVVAIVAVFVTVEAVRSGAASGAVAEWQAKLSVSRLVATLRERRLAREADERAAAERQILVEQIRQTAEHAAALEQELATFTDNPIVFPETLTKELRK